MIHMHHHLYKNFSLVRKLNLHFSVLWALYWMGWGALWSYLSVFLLYRGFTNAQIGLVTGCTSLLCIFIQPALAALADRDHRFTSRRLAMGLTVLLMVFGTWAWLSNSTLLTAVLLVISGIAVTNIPPHFNAMNMNMALRGLDVNFGASRGCGSAAYALTALVLGALLERHAPTLLMPVFLTCFGGLLAALLLMRYPLPSLDTDSKARVAPVVLSNFSLLRHYPRFALMLAACALLQISRIPAITYMNHIVGKVGGTESAMGVALFISALVELPAMVIFTRLRRKLPLHWLLIGCSLFFVLRDVLFLLAGTTTVVYLACAMQAPSYAIFLPATVYYVTEEIDIANQVKGQALVYTATSGIGSALGSLCSGYLLDHGGVPSTLIFGTLCALLGAAVMTLALSSGKRKETST